jgi:hypothetical protein
MHAGSKGCGFSVRTSTARRSICSESRLVHEKQIPHCVPRPPNCGGKEKARDCVRDDTLFLFFGLVGSRGGAAIGWRCDADGALKCAATKAAAERVQRLPGSMNLNRPLQRQRQPQSQRQRQRRRRDGGGTTAKAGAPLRLVVGRLRRNCLGASHARNLARCAAGRRQRSCRMRLEGCEDVVADGAERDTDGGAGQHVAEEVHSQDYAGGGDQKRDG